MSDLSKEKQLHMVMFPYFAFGHISPFVQLSNKLSLNGVKISFLSAPGNIARIKSTLKLTPSADVIPLPIPAIDGLLRGLDSTSDMTPAMAGLLIRALDMMQPQVETLLSELKPDFVFFDFAQYWLPKMATRLGIKSVYFSVFSALSGSLPSLGLLLSSTTHFSSSHFSIITIQIKFIGLQFSLMTRAHQKNIFFNFNFNFFVGSVRVFWVQNHKNVTHPLSLKWEISDLNHLPHHLSPSSVLSISNLK